MVVVKYWFLNGIKIAAWAISLSVFAPVINANSGSEEVLELGALLANLDDYQGEFTQVVYGPRQQILQEVEGSFLVKRPNYFKWVVKDPFPQVVVTQGKQLIVYDPDLEQATVRSLDSALDDTPASLLTGDLEQLDAGFLVSREDNSEQLTFRLTPRAEASLFEALIISFVDDKLDQLEIIDHMKQLTIIRFRDIVSDQPLSAADFEFELPTGTDVIGDVISP